MSPAEQSMNHTNHIIETREIAELSPHPRQYHFFRAPLETEIIELADDLKRNGQLTPVEILPDGIIVAGHKRVQAARRLDWSTVTVWVRHDLEGKPELAEIRLIEDNLNRRQLNPLEMARSYRALKSAGRRGHGRLSAQDHEDLRDQIGKRLDVSGRTLDRYLRVLEGTPAEVQDAVAAGSLGVSVAEKVAGLPHKIRKKIAVEIRAGKTPTEVIRQHLNPLRAQKKEGLSVHELLRVAGPWFNDLKRVGDLTDVRFSRAELTLLRRMVTILARLQQHALLVDPACTKTASNVS